ncbi:MAG: PEP-CTERM sorting domain-containing protein [Lentisphaeria bacterium]
MNTARLYLLLASGLLGLAGTASAAIIFSEDFTNTAAAAARFTVTATDGGWNGAKVSYAANNATIEAYQGLRLNLRTNLANNFSLDHGDVPVIYSVIESLSAKTGAKQSFFYVRLGETGYSDGYYLSHYNDGSSTTLSFYRLNGGVGTQLYTSGIKSVFNNTDPVTMAVTLANNLDGSVTYTLQYGAFSLTGTDTSANAITSGSGVGVGFNNNGTADWLSGTFDNLTVTTIPEPAALGLLGLAGLFLAGRRQRR